MAVVIKVGETEAVSVDIGEKVYIQGDPGFSPTIEVTDITGGHRLTITDINGGKTVDVMNGDKGEQGPKGDPGEVTQEEFDELAEDVADQKSAIEGKQDAPASAGTAGQVLGLDSNLNPVWVNQSGGGGTANYNDLSNKPQIEGVTLSGNKTAADLGLAKASDIPAVPVQSVNGKTGAVALNASDVGALPDSTAIPSKTSDLTNDSGFVNAAGAAAAAPVQSVNGSVGAVTVQSTITASGILKGNGSGGVSAAVAGTDYLTQATNYSPWKVISANYAIEASDIGKTIRRSLTNSALTITMPTSVANALPDGAEIGFLVATTGISSNATILDFSATNGCKGVVDGSARDFAKVKIVNGYDMVVAKKLWGSSAGGTWLIQGNVEVVS